MKITIVNRTKEEKTYTRVELDEFVNQLKDGTYHHHYIYSSQLLTPLSEEEPTFESCCKASYDPQEIPGVSLRTSRMMGLPQTYAARLATFIPLLTYKTEAYMKEHYTLRLNVMTGTPEYKRNAVGYGFQPLNQDAGSPRWVMIANDRPRGRLLESWRSHVKQQNNLFCTERDAFHDSYRLS